MVRILMSQVGIALLVVALAHPGCASRRPAEQPPGCTDIANTQQFNILTLNVLYDAPSTVRERSWAEIAQFAVANNVHVILVQEAVMTDVGRLADLLGTSDSARDFQRVLNGVSLEPYDLRVAWESGVPLVLATANAILSRCAITRHLWTFLPIETEEIFEGIDFKVTRNVELARINVPGYGDAHVYNTHLCSACSVEGRQRQVDALLGFVQQSESVVPSPHVLLSGDFNLDITTGGAEETQYQTIMSVGFRDVYAEFRRTAFGQPAKTLCANGIADVHCTDGVSPLRGLIATQTGADFSTPKRLDYIFLRGGDSIQASRVIFNPGNASTGPIDPDQPAVSDHSGVFAQITLIR